MSLPTSFDCHSKLVEPLCKSTAIKLSLPLSPQTEGYVEIKLL